MLPTPSMRKGPKGITDRGLPPPGPPDLGGNGDIPLGKTVG